MALIVIHVFKKRENEGTELLISAKQFLEKSIVSSKMVVVLISLFGFSILTFLFFLIVASLDSAASATQMFKYASGVFLGQLIIGLLFTSIILLSGTSFKRTGILVISTLLPVGIFIVNMSAVPILGAIAHSGDQLSSNITCSHISKNKNGQIETKDIYQDVGDSIKKNTDSSYKYFKYFDIWGQWSRDFNIIQQVPSGNQGTAGFYKTARLSTRNVKKDDVNIIKGRDGNDYVYEINYNYGSFKVNPALFNTVQTSLIKDIKNNPIPTNSKDNDKDINDHLTDVKNDVV